MTTTTSPQNLSEQHPPEATQPRLQPRRTLNRLALAAVGLGLGGVGQYFFSQDSVWDGLLLFIIGGLLLVRATGYHLYPRPYTPTVPAAAGPIIHQGWRRNVGLWLMLLAVGCSGLGYNAFESALNLRQGWWLYGGSILLFIGGGLLMLPGESPAAAWRRLIPSRAVGLGLALVMLLALFMRLYNFGEQPFGIWFDEAEAGLKARQMLTDPGYRPLMYPVINISGHLLGLYALALHWLGDTIYSMRLVSVLFGLGGVIAAYLFGRELRGPRFGLALALLMAVARWPVNFSRIAMTGIDAPFFEFLSLYFLVRLLKRGRLRDALWAGLSLGAGLLFYTAFRLFVLALVLFAVFALIRWWSANLATLRANGWQRYTGAAAVLLVSGWLVTMPLVRFALDNPEAFWYRTQQISILTKRDQPDLDKALLTSTQKHLQMFNIAGDKNGRHNLPGQPMLDPLMGVLFILGLALAIGQNRFPGNAFFLILFPVALLGGIFSVDFEAPQSLRSIAVIPALVYFCGLTLAAVGKEAERSLQPLPRAWLLTPAALVAAYLIFSNAHTYFVRQANDFASWNAFSAPETITGRKMAELGPGYTYILSPFLTNHPTTHFLAPEISNQEYLQMPDALPVRDSSGRPVALFIHPDEVWIYDEARRLYPNANFQILAGPGPDGPTDGPPSVYFARLMPENLAAVRGLDLRYLPTGDEETTLFAPLNSSRVYNINQSWPQDIPFDGTEDFIAEWSGVLYAPSYGVYRFRLLTPAGGMLEIDGNEVLTGYR